MGLGIVAFPEDPNPYQELLYGEMRALGATVGYVGRVTRSHTLNLLLLPLELAVQRARGRRIFHLHWTFGFLSIVGPRFSRWWFLAMLRVIRVLNYRLVWTAHNVLPHTPVFDDDLAARRALVGRCDLVIAHSQQTLAELARLGAVASCSAVIPQAAPVIDGLDQIESPNGETPRTILFFGRVEQYKGVEDLIAAAAVVRSIKIVIAGACADNELRGALVTAARGLEQRVTLDLRFQSEPELLALLRRADAVVFPFRRITTSSSVMLALASGRPTIVPDLPALADLPNEPLFRYRPGVDGLVDALREVGEASGAFLRAKGDAARTVAASSSWAIIAQMTVAAMSDCLNVPRSAAG